MRSILSPAITAVLLLAPSVTAQDLKDIKPPSDKEKKDVPDKHRGNEIVNGKNLYDWTRDLRDKDASVRERAIATIKVYGPDARQYASDVIRAMKDPDVSLKVNAVITLGWIGMEEKDVRDGLAALIGLLDNPQGIVRFQAVVALGNLGAKGNAAVARLIPMMRDRSSWEIRQAAARSLGQTGWAINEKTKLPVFDLRAFGALISALGDSCSEVRLEAIHGLITLGKPANTGDLLKEERALQSLLHEKPDRQPKKIGIWARVALMRIDKITEAHLTAISQHLTSNDLETRIEAAKALTAIGEGASSRVDDLIRALEDKDSRVVFWSCYALARMGHKALGALPALERLTQHDDQAVREMAAKATEEIKGNRPKNEAPEPKQRVNNKAQ
jgi:HEAT repeat protein